MKKRSLMKNLVTGGLVLVFGVVLSGCYSLKSVNLKFYDKTKPVEEYSRVYFYGDFWILSLNGDKKAYSPAPTIVIPSGENTFELVYYRSEANGSYTVVHSKSDPLILKYDFEPERFYYVYPMLQNRSFTTNVLDATDLSAQELRTMGFRSDIIEKIVMLRANSEEVLHKKAGK